MHKKLTSFAKLLCSYTDKYKDEAEKLAPLNDLLSVTTSLEQLYDRKNGVHITGSAAVLDLSQTKILLLHHKPLDRRLLPGGHIEKKDGSIQKGVLRELHEETGIHKSNMFCLTGNFPVDIDCHIIPENKAKNEAEHYHFDFRYLFKYTENIEIELDENESKNYQWVDLEKLEQIEPDYTQLSKKIKIRIREQTMILQSFEDEETGKYGFYNLRTNEKIISPKYDDAQGDGTIFFPCNKFVSAKLNDKCEFEILKTK